MANKLLSTNLERFLSGAKSASEWLFPDLTVDDVEKIQLVISTRFKKIGLFSSSPLSKYRVICLFYVLLRLNA